jgi:dTDP-4-dehydrorhamnose 3,5-epimerase
MIVEPLSLPGCVRIIPKLAGDARGIFLKPFVAVEYREHNLCTGFEEEFYSHSFRNVLRGMHFQTPPFECLKLVSCLYGNIRDVLLDLRVGSPRFKQCEIVELDAKYGHVLYLPPGIAHGFLVLSESAITSYKVTAPYVFSNDIGIKWDSIPVDWGVKEPIISQRDLSFQNLADYESPFVYDPEESHP